MKALAARTAHRARYLAAATRWDMQRRTQYRAATWIWSICSVLQLGVSLCVWQAVGTTAGNVGGYDGGAFVGYFVVLMLVRELTYSGMPWNVEDKVRSGLMTGELVKPIHPYFTEHAQSSAFRLMSFVIVVPAAVILYVWLDGTTHGSLASFGLAALLMPLANVTRLFADGIVATAAFRFTRVNGIREMYYLTLTFLGGQFVPLSVLPHWAELTAKAFPLYWTLGFPVELAIGKRPLSDWWLGLAVVLLWMVVLNLVLRVVWTRGVRALETVGT